MFSSFFGTIISSPKPEITIIMAHPVEDGNRVVLQHARGGIAPRLQLQMGGANAPAVIRMIQRNDEQDARVGNRVARERAEAVARGVNVVYEDTREEHFLEIVIPD
jgi:hypothetical protein